MRLFATEGMVEYMHDNDIQKKLLDLSKRASIIKADPKLRHAPNGHDIAIASENSQLMQLCQYQTINTEGDDA